MEYAKLGRSDVTVSRIGIGAMGFGVPDGQHPWTVDFGTSLAVVREAVDAGIAFFDTAFGYSGGTSEEYLGRALRECAKRDEVCIATKFIPPRAQTRAEGFSDAQWVRHRIETSLGRLREDYVDLYICN